MAVYTYTGKLADFGEEPFPGASPRLWVAPRKSAFARSSLAAARRMPIPVASDGTFEVDLIASIDLVPPVIYTLECDWFTVAVSGQEILAGRARWTFTAQIGGGPIATMPDSKLTRVWYATTQPPVNRSGIYWIHPTTGDVQVWS